MSSFEFEKLNEIIMIISFVGMLLSLLALVIIAIFF